MNLERKLESSLKTYLETIFTDLTVYDGHGDADIVDVPSLIVFAENAVKHADMPSSTGIKQVSVRFEITVDSQDEEDARDLIDAWERQLELAICADEIKAALNAPSVGMDVREVTGLHVYDVIFEQSAEGFEDTKWACGYMFNFTTQAFDELT